MEYNTRSNEHMKFPCYVIEISLVVFTFQIHGKHIINYMCHGGLRNSRRNCQKKKTLEEA